MRLRDLELFDPITIQCHDNPDADSLGADMRCIIILSKKVKKSG